MQQQDQTGIRLAATVILLRDGESGLETLMLKRPTTGSFADAWVWPGGAVEPQDKDGDHSANEVEAHIARRAAVRETMEETNLHVDVDQLVPHAIWSPPTTITPRYRTWFFLGHSPIGTPVAQEAEAVDLGWKCPHDMLDAHAREEVTLAVPTWVTLYQMLGSKTVAEALERSAEEPFEHYETRVRDNGNWFCWFGDAAFEDETGNGSNRHRLEAHVRPWRYITDPRRFG